MSPCMPNGQITRICIEMICFAMTLKKIVWILLKIDVK